MKKVISSVLVLFCILCLAPFSVSADTIDSSRSSSIHVNYQYGDVAITNTDVELYLLGTYDSSGNIVFADEYAPVSFNPNELDTMGLEVQAQKVDDFIISSKINPNHVSKTNNLGTCDFTGLTPGIYLVKYGVKMVDDYSYYASSVLVSIPVLQDDTYQYDIDLNVKTEREHIVIDQTPNGEKVSVPNTMDNVMYYGVLLVISVLVIFGIMTYIIKIREVKGEKNEKE